MRSSIDVRLTQKFSDYLEGLRDSSGKAAILARVKRLSFGNFGDAAPVGDGVSELRIHKGPGYRIYCKKVGDTVVVLLGAGTKNRQQLDIDAALVDAKAI